EMVRHDVDDHAHRVRVQRIDETLEILLRAELRIQQRVIHDVVAVHAAWPRLQDRRGIEMTDTELRQIRNDACSIVEREFAIQLNAIGRAGNRGRTTHTEAIDKRTSHGCRSSASEARADEYSRRASSRSDDAIGAAFKLISRRSASPVLIDHCTC